MGALEDFHKPPPPLSSDPQHTKFVDKAVNNVWLTLTGRISTIVCCVSVLVGGWTATQVYSAYIRNQDRIDQKLDSINDKFAAINDRFNKGAIDYTLLKAQYDNLVDATAAHFVTTDGRVTKIEADVENLKQRYYQLRQEQQDKDYPAPEDLARKKWQKR